MKKLIMFVAVMTITVGVTFIPSNSSVESQSTEIKKKKKWFEFIRVYNSMNEDGSVRCGLGRGLCNH